MAGEQRTYKIGEWTDRLSAALDTMRENTKPGAARQGGKRDVLLSLRGKMRALLEEGYSAAEIADVFRANGLSVLPKSVTEAAREAKPSPRRAKRVTKASDVDSKKASDQNNNGKPVAPESDADAVSNVVKTVSEPVAAESPLAPIPPATPASVERKPFWSVPTRAPVIGDD